MNLSEPWLKLTQKIPSQATLFLFFFSLYLFSMSGAIAYGDEIEKYRVAQSIVERQEFSFRPTAVRNIAGVEGRTFSLYELGQTLLQVPFYAAGKFLNTYFPTADPNQLEMLVVGFLNPLLSALACVIVFETSRVIGFRARTALTLAVMYGLASMAMPYARSYTREPLLALTLLLAVGALFQFEKTRAYSWLSIAGLAAGYLVFSKFIHAIVLPFLLIYAALAAQRVYRAAHLNIAAVRQKMGIAILVFLSPILVFLVVQAIYSFARFGSVLVGYSTKVNPLEWILFLIVQSQPHIATLGLLFSPEKSFFLYNPLALLCFLSMPLWWQQHKPQAFLILALVSIEFLAVITRPDWDGGTWWGPRYLVQLTPLLILSLGFLLESPRVAASHFWRWSVRALFGLSVGIQMLGVVSNERDFLDVTGEGITVLGQLDLLRYGALDSLFIYLLPTGSPVNINPASLALGLGLLALGAILYYQWTRDNIRADAPRLSSLALIVIVLAVELGALLIWLVAPYSRILAAKANTRFVAAERLAEAGRVCEARVMYRLALDHGTTLQRQAIIRYEQIQVRGQGIVLTTDDLMSGIEMSNGAFPEKDYVTALTPEGTLRLNIPGERDATIMLVSTPIQVTPNTRYELSGWWKMLNVYGTHYASIALYQDNGNWQHGKTTDIASLDETHGWQPFQYIITTLPTTQRLMVKVALWQTYGTVWVDDVRLVANPNPAPACK
ncbi:MAG: hypothetical protein HY868_18265 [Chloroflexi bacterium]|nr:hypothetical protein [Chloroflexota bacterium]